jgi:diguanylate cyclase (GGDEF)-like protein
MIDDFTGKYGNKNKRYDYIVLAVGIFFYLIGIVFFFFYETHDNRNKILEHDDNIIKNAAYAIPEILGPEFHDSLTDKNSISQEKDYQNIIKLSEFAGSLNLKFLYTVIFMDDGIHFTSSSATGKELADGTYVRYFDRYENPPRVILDHSIGKNGTFIEYSDKWGEYRSFIIPFTSKNGRTYLAVADMDMKMLNSEISDSTVKTVFITSFFLLLIIPLFILQYMNIKKGIKTENDKLYRDILTNLPNRNKLNVDIINSITPNLFQINIDSLKSINDYYGYIAGDFVIKEIANRILFFLISEEYNLYKLESDEFAILLDKEITRNEADTLSRFFIESISEKPFNFDGNEIHITVTIGVALNIGNDKGILSRENCNELCTNSDLALKKAVLNKKNYFIFDQSVKLNNEYEGSIRIIKKLKESIKNDSIVPFYQPIMNNMTGKIDKYESLIRIKDNGEILTPLYFLDISKKSKFYPKLTRIIIHKTFEILKVHESEFSINISINDILDEETIIFLKYKMDEFREFAGRIVFELLESEGIENYDDVKSFIDFIKSYGSKIAIDDFGSGYSNFGHLIKLKVDYIKLDSMIIKKIDTDKNNLIMAKNINHFAHELGIKTIAEYVHSEKVLELVKETGIDYSQGYYIGEPRENV